MEVQVVVQAVFVMITTVDCDICSSPSVDDKAAVPGALTAETDVVLVSGTLDVAGIMPLTRSSSIEEVGKVRAALNEVEVE
jgi:hypothetical protein